MHLSTTFLFNFLKRFLNKKARFNVFNSWGQRFYIYGPDGGSALFYSCD